MQDQAWEHFSACNQNKVQGTLLNKIYADYP